MADVLHSGTSITGGHTNAVAAGAAGFMSGTDKSNLDGLNSGATQALRKDGSVAATADLPMGTHKLTGLSAGSAAGHSVRYEQVALLDGSQAFTGVQSGVDPTAAANLTTRAYVDLRIANVAAVATAALPAYTASGGPGVGRTITASAAAAPTLDGVYTPVVGDSFYLPIGVAAAAADAGVYTWTTVTAPFVAVRDTRFDTGAKVFGSLFRVQYGVQCAGNVYANMNVSSPTVDTTPLVFLPTSDSAKASNERRVLINDEWLYPNVAANAALWPNGLVQFNSGTGAAATAITTGSRMGVMSFSAGTTATGACSAHHNAGGSGVPLGTNAGLYMDLVLAVPTASDGTNTFTCHAGVSDGATLSVSSIGNGIAIGYEQTTSANWLLITAHAATLTKTSTGIAVNSTDAQFIVIKVPGEDVYRCYNNGSLVATNSTNVPVSTDTNLDFSITIKKSAGTTARTFEVNRTVALLDLPARFAA